jgi:mannitol 2-dehydrogenase
MAFGSMVAALVRRRAAGKALFTGLSRDNLRSNGEAFLQTVVGRARRFDAGRADWVATEWGVPDPMVDCIDPAMGPEKLTPVQRFGILDAAPVTHESCRNWVIDDRLAAGRPLWERAGVILGKTVHAYETMKIRVLNAGHRVPAGAGAFLGLSTIADHMAHGAPRRFFGKVRTEEIVPYVGAVPHMSAPDLHVRTGLCRPHRRAVLQLGHLGHRSAYGLRRLLAPPRFLAAEPTPCPRSQRHDRGVCSRRSALGAHVRQNPPRGAPIAPNDPTWSEMTEAALQAGRHPRVWLDQRRF